MRNASWDIWRSQRRHTSTEKNANWETQSKSWNKSFFRIRVWFVKLEYSMNEPYTEFSASLSIVWFEFAGFSRHSLRLYPFSRKQNKPTVLFSLPVLDIRQSYLFLIWRARSQEMLYGMKSRVTHLQHLYRCGRGILPWCFASWMTIVNDARHGSLSDRIFSAWDIFVQIDPFALLSTD